MTLSHAGPGTNGPAPLITVQVLLFAALRERAGTKELQVSLEQGDTVATLRERIAAECPAIAPLLPNAAVAINETYAADDLVLMPGDAAALIPPVSGG